MIQEPVVVLDYVGTINTGQFVATDGVPIVGQCLIYGMVYSSQIVTLDLQQGINDNLGSFVYRHSKMTTVLAGSGTAIEFPVHGKYCRIVITNSSGFSADVEAFFCARPYE